MENSRDIQWFPGHMAKTKRIIEENLHLVDVVIDLRDARAPYSSTNPMLEEILGQKQRVIALNKSDLADEKITSQWLSYFEAKGIPAATVDSVNGKGIHSLVKIISKLAAGKTGRIARGGGKARAARAMTVGIPNVGKSSLINRLAGAAKAKVENRPGVTRDKQWIKIAKNVELMDTPGILWPKFEDQEVAVKLALINAISDDVYDVRVVASALFSLMSKRGRDDFVARYGTDALNTDFESAIDIIGRRRGCLKKGGVIDEEKVCRLLVADCRGGKLGRVSFDLPPSTEEAAYGYLVDDNTGDR